MQLSKHRKSITQAMAKYGFKHDIICQLEEIDGRKHMPFVIEIIDIIFDL